MPTEHIVSEGESVVGLAEQYGLFAQTIWDDSANAQLKQKRKSMSILLPGDVVVIPDKRLKEVSKASGQKHRFKRKGVPAVFRLQLFDDNKPRARQNYILTVDGRLYKGTTDQNGILQETVSPQAREAQLKIGPDNFQVTLKLGQLDPDTALSGVQKRLTNLGFPCGDPTGEMNEATRGALLQFQKTYGLPKTGEADSATMAKIQEVHETAGKVKTEST